MGRVASARLSADDKSLENVKTLIEGADIQPRALAQARDGTLLIASAGIVDAGPAAAGHGQPHGQVLRINADGSIPKDNPFVADRRRQSGDLGAGLPRHPLASLIHPDRRTMGGRERARAAATSSTSCARARTTASPAVSYGRQNNGAMINGGKTAQDGIEQPIYFWNPSIAPSGLMVYTGKAFPAWKDNVFVGGMSGMQVSRLVMNGEKVVGEEKLLMDRCERIKVIEQGPDGYIYILTDQMAPNEILRLVPAKTVPAPRAAPAAAPAK